MIEPKIPRFDWGHRVVARTELYNDGSYPDREPEALLIDRGAIGEVVQVGMHTESETPVYLVEFPGGLVVGCLEEEIERV